MTKPASPRSFGFFPAVHGLREAIRTQRNFRNHLIAAAAVTGAGWLAGLPAAGWGVLALAIGLVTAAECMNTAIEYLTDLVMPDHHERAGKIKDLAAGAVLLCAIAAAAAGIAVFWPVVHDRLSGGPQ